LQLNCSCRIVAHIEAWSWVALTEMSDDLILAVGLIGLFIAPFVWIFVGGFIRGFQKRGRGPKSIDAGSPTARTANQAAPKVANTEKPGERTQTTNASSRRVSSTAFDSSPTDRSTGPGNIFVSYRRSDTADVTGRIYDRLVERFGKETVFKDVDSIPLGVDFREHLDQMVARCRVLLVVIGDDWVSAVDETGRKRLEDPRDFVHIEIEAALRRRVPVIPVLVQGASVPAESELPAGLSTLSYRNGIPVRPDPDFHRDMDRLVAGIETHFRHSQ
jgi:hypothetical protein